MIHERGLALLPTGFQRTGQSEGRGCVKKAALKRQIPKKRALPPNSEIRIFLNTSVVEIGIFVKMQSLKYQVDNIKLKNTV